MPTPKIHSAEKADALGYQGRFLASRVPQWLVDATPAQRQTLRRLIADSQHASLQVRQRLAGWQSPSEFATPLLKQALKSRFGLEPDLLGCSFAQVVRSSRPASERPGPILKFWQRPLLEAALQNFVADEVFDVGSGLVDADGQALPIDPVEFATLCHSLDLGGRYQAHVARIFPPAFSRGGSTTPTQTADRALFVRNLRAAWRLDLYQAKLQGGIDGQVYSQLKALFDSEAGLPAAAFGLSLWGLNLDEIMLLEVEGADNSGNRPVIVYLPTDSGLAFQRYSSRQAFFTQLIKKLQGKPFQRAFARFISQRDRCAYFQQVEQVFNHTDVSHAAGLVPTPVDPRKVMLEAVALQGGLAQAQYDRHRLRIKDDALFLAVSSADVDARQRLERLESWLDAGINVLNVIGTFVPVLGLLLIPVAAAQLLGQFFHGVEAWEQGHSEQALDYLMGMVENLIVVGALAGAHVSVDSVFEPAVHAGPFARRLQLISTPSGRQLLWAPHMQAYRQTLTLPEGLAANALGQYSLDNRLFVRLDDDLYEVARMPDNSWGIVDPAARQAWSPPLRHNGEGAWWLAHEDPDQWAEDTLLQRLGPRVRRFNEATRRHILDISGVTAQQLRQAYLENRSLPSLLSDTFERFELRADFDAMIEQLALGKTASSPLWRTVAAHCVQAGEWPQSVSIRVFEGAEPWGQDVVFQPAGSLGLEFLELTSAELLQGELPARLLARLNEDSLTALMPDGLPVSALQRLKSIRGWFARLGRTGRSAMLETAYQQANTSRDPLAAVLIRDFPSLPARAAEEILSRASTHERGLLQSQQRVPLRLAQEARLLVREVRINRLLESQPLKPLEEPAARRAEAARALGLQPLPSGFKSPLRLANGRLGYPLSPQQPSTSVSGRLAALYPDLSHAQLQAMEASLLSRFRTADAGVLHLETELRLLRRTLDTWVNNASIMSFSGLDAQESMLARQEHVMGRSNVRDTLIAAWQRRVGSAPVSEADEGSFRLNLSGHVTGEFPGVFANFNHVTELAMDDMQLSARDIAGFLRRFPRLRHLSLQSNLLEWVPEDVSALTELRSLDLSENNLQSSAQMFQRLPALTALRELRLNHNEISLPDEAIVHIGRLRQLQILDLENNLIHLSASQLAHWRELPLTELYLDDNDITLTPSSVEQLAGFSGLRILIMSNNPLQLAPDLSQMLHLRALGLSSAQIEVWPEGLSQLMDLAPVLLRQVDLSNNLIEEVPDLSGLRWAALDLQTPGFSFQLEGNPLNAVTLERLGTLGIQVDQQQPFVNERAWLQGVDTEDSQRWALLQAEPHSRGFFEVLSRLTRSAEFHSNRVSLHQRVWRVIDAAAGDDTLRQAMFSIADDYPATCGDAGALGFSELEVQLQVHQAASTAPAEVVALFRGLYRRELITTVADRVVQARLARRSAMDRNLDLAPFPLDPVDDIDDLLLAQFDIDDVEVRLTFRLELAQRLGFSEPVESILFGSMAEVSPAMLDRAFTQVVAQDTVAARREWVSAQPGWRRFLRMQHSARFEEVQAPWALAQEYLDECLMPSTPVSLPTLSAEVTAGLEAALGIAIEREGVLQLVSPSSEQYRVGVSYILDQREQAATELVNTLTAQLID
ncbi:NEL-type E3 ubiquitin ligase domain-containing protein [Pseudomonas sp. R5(2019)]|uniref:NEL-type E3 ubiquitin ligase domain-containing protein n=1 Tax=Pseudomonas sp. R5(2019) TaxID=2697566 RepID=UPI0014134B2D|nr:NEL-type E3 ubiquitin ligase domain-containing protein [Pseudomonas sp. R5(2019)]NBA93936.1 hypothetical protein [Pseudomonas sp. R5(2019)]